MEKTEFVKNIINAPLSVRVGRVLLRIGCILFFIMAAFNIAVFVLAFFNEETRNQYVLAPVAAKAIVFYAQPLLAVLFVLAAIGGLCYLSDRFRFKRMCSLAAVILLVVFVIDTVLSVRNLIYDLVSPDITAGTAWATFLISLIDIQLSGGLYFIGWAMQKDYMGD